MMHINDAFFTIQGEGFYSGRRALFVRMPFCDLACPWCDTSFNEFKEWSDQEFLTFAAQEKTRFAVITGGEPTMHKHTPQVVALLTSLGYHIAIESNGHFPIPHGIDFVTISPKSYGKEKFFIHPDAFKKAHEFKYVVEFGFDFSVLDRHDVLDGRRYSLSPEFNSFKESLDKILEYTKENPDWRINLQTHKYMGVP